MSDLIMNEYVSFILVIIGTCITFFNYNISESLPMDANLEFTVSSIQPTLPHLSLAFIGLFLISAGIIMILFRLWFQSEEMKDESDL